METTSSTTSSQGNEQQLQEDLRLGLSVVKELWHYPALDWITSVYAADIDGDGDIEILFGSRNGSVKALSKKRYLKWHSVNQNNDWVGAIYCINNVDATDRTRVIVGSRYNKVIAYDEIGQVCWQFPTNQVVRSIRVLDINNDGKAEVIVGSEDRFVYVLSCDSGKLIWKFETNGWVRSVFSYDIDNDSEIETIAASGDKHIYILDSKGQLKWKHNTGNKTHALAVVDLDKDGEAEILISSDAKDLYAMTSDGHKKWQFFPINRIHTINVIDFNHDGFDEVIAASEDENIYILGHQGDLLWKHFVGCRIFSIYSIDLDRDGLCEILVGTENNSIQVLRIELLDGLLPRIIASYNTLGSPPLSTFKFSLKERLLLRDIAIELIPHVRGVTMAHVQQRMDEQDYVSALSTILTLHQQHTQLLWMNNTIGHIRSIVVKKSLQNSNMDIIIGTDEGDIKAFDCTGTILWSYSFAERVRTMCTAYFNQNGAVDILVGTADGHVSALSDTGQIIKWQTRLEDWVESICTTDTNSPTASEMIICSADKKIHIYTNNFTSTIDPITTSQSIRVVRTHDINNDGLQEIIAGTQDCVYAYTYEGKLLWTHKTLDRVNAICIKDIDQDGHVEILVSSEDRNLYVLGDTGILKWRYNTPHRVLDVYAIDIDQDGQIEVFLSGGSSNGNGKLYVLNSVGDMLWQFEANDRIRVVYGVDINNDGTLEILVGSEDCLYILQMLDLKKLEEQIEVCWQTLLTQHSSSQVLRLLIEHEDPMLRAFALTKLVEQPESTEQDIIYLNKLLTDDSFEVRRAFARSIVPLYKKNPRKIRTFLENLSKDRQHDIRLALIENVAYLAVYDPQLSFEYLDRFTRNINVWIRRAVVRQLDQLLVSYPQQVFHLLLNTVQDVSDVQGDADWIRQESARVFAHYLDMHTSNLLYTMRLFLVKDLEPSLLDVVIHCATTIKTREVFRIFYNLRTKTTMNTILPMLKETIMVLQDMRTLLCGDNMYNIYNEFYLLHSMRTVSDIAQYRFALVNTYLLEHTGQHTYFDNTFRALNNFNSISNLLRIYLRRRGLGESISSLLDALAALDKLSSDMKNIYFAWCQNLEQFPDYAILNLLLMRWRSIIAIELSSLRGKAELEPELQTKRVEQEEQVGILLRVHNKGRSPADRVTITLKQSEDFTIVEHPVRVFETISTREPITAEFTIIPKKTVLRLTFDIKYDDAEAKGKILPFGDKLELVQRKQTFTHIHNPYHTGIPVQDQNMFYGRQDELTLLQEDFVYSSANTIVVLYGQRRSGKSSLLLTLLNTQLLEPHIPVHIDMQHETMNFSTSQFLRRLAYAIYRTLIKRKILVSMPNKANFDEDPIFALDIFLDEVEVVLKGRKLVILIDEFEVLEEKVAKNELSKDIFSYLRSLMQYRGYMHFLLAGTHMIKELTTEYWSVFFNIAIHRRLSELTKQAAQQLIIEPVEGRVEYDPFAIEKILHLTGNQPYLIQLICHVLVQHCNIHRKNYVTINDVNIVLDDVMQTGTTYFSWIWQQASQEERVIMAVVAQEGGDEGRYVSVADIERVYRDNNWPYKREHVLRTLQKLCDGDILVEATRENCFTIKTGLTRTWLRDTKSLKQVILEEDLLDWH